MRATIVILLAETPNPTISTSGRCGMSHLKLKIFFHAFAAALMLSIPSYAQLPYGTSAQVCASSAVAGMYYGYGQCTDVYNGVSRFYSLHIPANYVVGNELIVGLHMDNSSGATFQSTTGYPTIGNT